PLRVICHGGPTGHSAPGLELDTQFFTQRGIGVVDVNYRGSSGFGREYRRLLNGRWGEIDWQDCVDAARFLAAEGNADDEVVPPSQAEAMVEVLERKGIPYAYISFEGEGHGFRKQENISRTLEAT